MPVRLYNREMGERRRRSLGGQLGLSRCFLASNSAEIRYDTPTIRHSRLRRNGGIPTNDSARRKRVVLYPADGNETRSAAARYPAVNNTLEARQKSPPVIRLLIILFIVFKCKQAHMYHQQNRCQAFAEKSPRPHLNKSLRKQKELYKHSTNLQRLHQSEE